MIGQILGKSDAYYTRQCWRLFIADVIKEIAIGAEFADHHDGCFLGIVGHTDTKLDKFQREFNMSDRGTHKANNVLMTEIT